VLKIQCARPFRKAVAALDTVFVDTIGEPIMSAGTVIDNGVIIPVTPDRPIIPSGHVFIEDGRIAVVAGGQFDGGADILRIDARGGFVLPGLIDTHAHAGHALTKSLGADAAEWMGIAGRIYATSVDAEFWRAEAALSALERLCCGTTTACLVFGGGPDVMRTASPRDAEAHLGAIEQTGLSHVLAVGPNRPDGPDCYLDWAGTQATRQKVTAAGQLACTSALIERWHGASGGLIRLAASPPVFSPADLATSRADAIVALSREVRRLATDHRVLLVQDGHRDGSIELAGRRLGILGADCLLAHCIDLTDADMAALVDPGASVAHNPSALMSVFGRCPAPELAARGVTVALGTDAPAPDRPFDMFRTMFVAHRTHARHFADDRVLPPWEVLEMATIRGARALSLEHEIGSLQAGKRADIIIVDARSPHLWPPAEPVHRLTRFAGGADVATVMVNGRVLMRDRQVVGVDPERVLRDAHVAYATMLGRAGLLERFPPLPVTSLR
jgi:5-methylthioadenosine/S-adenosylhomocysteine deaminase